MNGVERWEKYFNSSRKLTGLGEKKGKVEGDQAGTVGLHKESIRRKRRTPKTGPSEGPEWGGLF